MAPFIDCTADINGTQFKSSAVPKGGQDEGKTVGFPEHFPSKPSQGQIQQIHHHFTDFSIVIFY